MAPRTATLSDGALTPFAAADIVPLVLPARAVADRDGRGTANTPLRGCVFARRRAPRGSPVAPFVER